MCGHDIPPTSHIWNRLFVIWNPPLHSITRPCCGPDMFELARQITRRILKLPHVHLHRRGLRPRMPEGPGEHHSAYHRMKMLTRETLLWRGVKLFLATRDATELSQPYIVSKMRPVRCNDAACGRGPHAIVDGEARLRLQSVGRHCKLLGLIRRLPGNIHEPL
jgi:hypothetical protein